MNEQQARHQLADTLRAKPAYWAMQELNPDALADALLPAVRALIADELDTAINQISDARDVCPDHARRSGYSNALHTLQSRLATFRPTKDTQP